MTLWMNNSFVSKIFLQVKELMPLNLSHILVERRFLVWCTHQNGVREKKVFKSFLKKWEMLSNIVKRWSGQLKKVKTHWSHRLDKMVSQTSKDVIKQLFKTCLKFWRIRFSRYLIRLCQWSVCIKKLFLQINQSIQNKTRASLNHSY